jgi:hypothetical protein
MARTPHPKRSCARSRPLLGLSLCLPLFLLPLSPCVPGTQGARLRCSLRLEGLAGLQSRLLLEMGGARFLYLEKRPVGGGDARLLPEQCCVGLDCPWLTVGPVRRSGLLQRSFSPIGAGPGSAAVEEAASLRFSSAWGCTGRGAALRLMQGRLSLLLLGTEGELGHAGATLLLGLPGGGRLEGLLLLSRPGPPSEGEAWFEDRAPFPGGLLAHAGSALLLRADGLELGLSVIASGGQRCQPGLTMQLRLLAELESAEAELLLGGCSPGYLTAAGEAPARLGLVGGRLRLRLAAVRTLAVTYRASLGSAGLAPGALAGTGGGWWTRLRHEMGLEALWSWRGPSGGPVGLRAELDAELGYGEEGTPRPEAGLELQLRLGRANRESSLGLFARLPEEGWEAGFQARCARPVGVGRLGLECRGALLAGEGCSLALSGSWSTESLRLEASVRTARPLALGLVAPRDGSAAGCSAELLELCCFSLGCELRIRAPGSPR